VEKSRIAKAVWVSFVVEMSIRGSGLMWVWCVVCSLMKGSLQQHMGWKYSRILACIIYRETKVWDDNNERDFS